VHEHVADVEHDDQERILLKGWNGLNDDPVSGPAQTAGEVSRFRVTPPSTMPNGMVPLPALKSAGEDSAGAAATFLPRAAGEGDHAVGRLAGRPALDGLWRGGVGDNMKRLPQAAGVQVLDLFAARPR
jgi:hypothetical protein